MLMDNSRLIQTPLLPSFDSPSRTATHHTPDMRYVGCDRKKERLIFTKNTLNFTHKFENMTITACFKSVLKIFVCFDIHLRNGATCFKLMIIFQFLRVKVRLVFMNMSHSMHDVSDLRCAADLKGS